MLPYECVEPLLHPHVAPRLLVPPQGRAAVTQARARAPAGGLVALLLLCVLHAEGVQPLCSTVCSVCTCSAQPLAAWPPLLTTRLHLCAGPRLPFLLLRAQALPQRGGPAVRDVVQVADPADASGAVRDLLLGTQGMVWGLP